MRDEPTPNQHYSRPRDKLLTLNCQQVPLGVPLWHLLLPLLPCPLYSRSKIKSPTVHFGDCPISVKPGKSQRLRESKRRHFNQIFLYPLLPLPSLLTLTDADVGSDRGSSTTENLCTCNNILVLSFCCSRLRERARARERESHLPARERTGFLVNYTCKNFSN